MSPSETTNDTPMIEIFGGIFALMLVLFLIITFLAQASLKERLEAASEEGLYRVGWGTNGTGFVVLTFPKELRIIENSETVVLGEICQPGSPFVQYAQRIYSTPKQQIIFAILEGSVPTMAEARNCIMAIMPNRTLAIGWLIASNELLKSISLNDIPPYIKKAVE